MKTPVTQVGESIIPHQGEEFADQVLTDMKVLMKG